MTGTDDRASMVRGHLSHTDFDTTLHHNNASCACVRQQVSERKIDSQTIVRYNASGTEVEHMQVGAAGRRSVDGAMSPNQMCKLSYPWLMR